MDRTSYDKRWLGGIQTNLTKTKTRYFSTPQLVEKIKRRGSKNYFDLNRAFGWTHARNIGVYKHANAPLQRLTAYLFDLLERQLYLKQKS